MALKAGRLLALDVRVFKRINIGFVGEIDTMLSK